MDLYFTQTISTFAATAIFSFEDKVYMQIMPLLFNFIKLLIKKIRLNILCRLSPIRAINANGKLLTT